MALYLARKMTSKELAEATGYSAVYLRRTIKREPLPTDGVNTKAHRESRAKLLQARQAFRLSIGHLPLATIRKKANVSESTALRIKRKYKEAQK